MQIMKNVQYFKYVIILIVPHIFGIPKPLDILTINLNINEEEKSNYISKYLGAFDGDGDGGDGRLFGEDGRLFEVKHTDSIEVGDFNVADFFLVGGGGGGSAALLGAGGGSGFIRVLKNLSLEEGQHIDVTIGSAGNTSGIFGVDGQNGTATIVKLMRHNVTIGTFTVNGGMGGGGLTRGYKGGDGYSGGGCGGMNPGEGGREGRDGETKVLKGGTFEGGKGQGKNITLKFHTSQISPDGISLSGSGGGGIMLKNSNGTEEWFGSGGPMGDRGYDGIDGVVLMYLYKRKIRRRAYYFRNK